MTFTSLDGKYNIFPTNIDSYKGTTLEGDVTLHNGIQFWKVPFTGMYTIEAIGASGANGTNSIGIEWRRGGLGARIKGSFNLQAGETLKILVGQTGSKSTAGKQQPGGGGGGSFVTTINNTTLVIAGGGGGGAAIFDHGETKDGDPGQALQNGTRYGGVEGEGGRRFDRSGKLDLLKGAAGGGFRTDGESSFMSEGGKSFLRGGNGGTSVGASGGFGGGGSGLSHPGGGGGYSGGGVEGDGSNFAAAGGGGSFNSGKNQENETGVNMGNGKVVIRFIK